MSDSFPSRTRREILESTRKLTELLPPLDVQGSGLLDAIPKFQFRRKPAFTVEFRTEGNDIVYHFWPPDGCVTFRPGFANSLEAGFMQVLPPGADVRAEWTSHREALAQHLLAADQDPASRVEPRESYYVRVIGWANNPLADRILKNRVFDKVEEAVRLSL